MRAVMLALIALGGALSTFQLIAAPRPEESLQSDQVRTLSAKARGILIGLKKTCDELRLHFVGSTEFHPTFVNTIREDTYDPMMIVGPTIHLGSDGPGQDFEFRQVDGRLISYGNGLIEDLAKNKIVYDKPDQPKWSVERAIAIGTAFKKVLMHSDDVMLSKPVAEYVHTAGDNRLGQWMISWSRLDSSGHPFYGDHITIQIQEGFGPLGAGIHLTTPYVEEKGVPMKKSDAILIATEAVKTKQVDRGFESYADGDTLTGNVVEKTDLIIVLPWKNIKVFGGLSTGIARLAWVVWLRPQHSKKPTHDLYDDSFSVWVDAYNGAILGTDGWL